MFPGCATASFLAASLPKSQWSWRRNRPRHEWVSAASAAIRTTCPYCGVGCGLLIESDGSVAGDPDHPANHGSLCSKGAALGESFAPADRLLRPQIDGRSASWDEALDHIAASFARAIAEHGPDAVAL